MDAGVLALFIPLLALVIPIVAILVKPATEAGKRSERVEARKTYERIAVEKLEVIKTALTMGLPHDQLVELDARLEKLIGSDKLKGLLEDTPTIPVASQELLDTDLDSEIRRLHQRQGQKA